MYVARVTQVSHTHAAWLSGLVSISHLHCPFPGPYFTAGHCHGLLGGLLVLQGASFPPAQPVNPSEMPTNKTSGGPPTVLVAFLTLKTKLLTILHKTPVTWPYLPVASPAALTNSTILYSCSTWGPAASSFPVLRISAPLCL